MSAPMTYGRRIKPGVSSAALCRLLDVTYRQLDFWIRRGFLGDNASLLGGSGNHRRFTGDEVYRVAFLAEAAKVWQDNAPFPERVVNVALSLRIDKEVRGPVGWRLGYARIEFDLDAIHARALNAVAEAAS